MSRWKRDETYRKRAKEVGYRSRAGFKILEIDKRFEILKDAHRVVDLCCAPGSWLQVIRERCVAPESIIVGVDQTYVQPIQGVYIIQESIESPDLIQQLRDILQKPADAVLSDCAPRLTGNKSLDRERQVWLAKLSFQLATELLERKGSFVTKVFQSEAFRDFTKQVKECFNLVKTYKPQSSFKRSPEMYLIAKGYRGCEKPPSQDVL
ncbi:MAG: RlmE family RNA methyltransferase [Promethearchaeota archaeon]